MGKLKLAIGFIILVAILHIRTHSLEEDFLTKAFTYEV